MFTLSPLLGKYYNEVIELLIKEEYDYNKHSGRVIIIGDGPMVVKKNSEMESKEKYVNF